jgi:hypothetical protein
MVVQKRIQVYPFRMDAAAHCYTYLFFFLTVAIYLMENTICILVNVDFYTCDDIMFYELINARNTSLQDFEIIEEVNRLLSPPVCG